MSSIDANDLIPTFTAAPLPPNLLETADPQDVWIMAQLDIQRQQNAWLIESSRQNRELIRDVRTVTSSLDTRIGVIEQWKDRFTVKTGLAAWALTIVATATLTYFAQWLLRHILKLAAVLALVWVALGCSFNSSRESKLDIKQVERGREILQAAKAANDIGKQRQLLAGAALATIPLTGESSNAVTKARLTYSGASVAYDLSSDFIRRGQSLAGLPAVDQNEIVRDLLSEIRSVRESAAAKERSRGLQEESWAGERAQLNAKLLEMGKKYEEEKNRHIVKRVWRSLLSTFGIGGIIALCIFCPALIPILGRILAWVVSQVPQLAGAVGVVSTKAFDALVRGVQRTKTESDSVHHADTLLDNLSKEMDASHKGLVAVRLPVAAKQLAT